ncbi:MAG TPA: hypothetical protein PKE49_10315 [Leptospiraceae bacterium]|jgi:hypothetical protein|nr:hypothetical protein [Leptospirales bacterium]HMU85409.1 hypothetical protein [Leptospiraceae bacterium]HMW59404.1 hypothetical protein [Leptospiraceae bacterium]HMX56907.1 hypothetical protein [Leptospiraceae bacterium]HMY45151.1 hypothetical protein [Leptospiraceae bacterium]
MLGRLKNPLGDLSALPGARSMFFLRLNLAKAWTKIILDQGISVRTPKILRVTA